MIKYFFFFSIFFYLQRPCVSIAQVLTDTVQTTVDSAALVSKQDSILSNMEPGDSDKGLNRNPYSLYRISAHTGYMMPDSLRTVPRNQLDKYLLDPDFAYANDDAFWKKEVARSPAPIFNILNSPWLWWIFVFFVTVLVLVIISQLSLENSFGFFKRRFKKRKNPTELHMSVLETDYESAINKCQEEGNYRLAIRYMYLRLVLTVSKKSDTVLLRSVTNSDLARSLGDFKQASEFRWLATAFEYIFYGGFAPQKDLFDLIKLKYEDLMKKIAD